MKTCYVVLVVLLSSAGARAQGFIVPSPVPAFTDGCVLVYNGTTGLLECGSPAGAGQPLTDALGLVANDATPSKVLRFDVSGITSSTTRTWTIPDANLTIPASFLTLPISDSTALLSNAATPSKLVRFDLSGLTASTTRVITVPDASFTMVTLPIVDTAIILKDATDATKQLRIELGSIATGTTRVWTAPDSDVTIGSGGGGGATLSSNTFTGDQTIAKNTPQIIMQDTSSGLGSASVATILMQDSTGASVLQVGNTSSGYARIKANQGGLTLEDSTGQGIYINGGVATFNGIPVWSSGLGAVSGTTGAFNGTLGTNGTFTSTAALNTMVALAPPANVTNGSYIDFKNAAGTVIGSVTELAGNASIAFNTTSDERLKVDLGPATDTSELRGLVVHRFQWRAYGQELHEPGPGPVEVGVFAQEAYRVAPRAIVPGTDERNSAGSLIRPWQVDYTKWVPSLIVGWQQHEARLLELEALVRRGSQ